MKKIEITKAYADGNIIRYEVREDAGLGLLQQEKVELFIRYHFGDGKGVDFAELPQSILILPISLYLIPITYFYDVEVVIPEMDRDLYEHLPRIYAAYSKVYGPFKDEWRGKIIVKKIVENKTRNDSKYDKVVFFSGGVDACHAGINNPGKKSLLVSIPDIETQARNEGPLREEKFSLIKNFANVVNSDWLLIANNFNAHLYKDREINRYLGVEKGMCTPAYKFDGWYGIKYIANMCCVAPVAYLTGTKALVMGAGYEELENKYFENLDGANPAITDAFSFANIPFEKQDGMARRTSKIKNIVCWCKSHREKVKIWVCFADRSTQCGFCHKCVRTQLEILCAGENPREWGFEDFSEKKFFEFVRSYQYWESTPCWLWDCVDTIDDKRVYPCLNELLHWLKKIGYKEYFRCAEKRHHPSLIARALCIGRYPHYAKVVFKKLIG